MCVPVLSVVGVAISVRLLEEGAWRGADYYGKGGDNITEAKRSKKN